jgi:catechol 2,3-dioxygenase-like lactoylglutathione lyase family enzyme
MTGIQRMDHFTVVTDDLPKSQAFYELLGLQAGPRPDFNLQGLWMYVGGHPVLHLVRVDQMPTPRRGVLDHMAFWGADLQATLSLLQREKVAYRALRLPVPFNHWQVFFFDPNGVEVEIDFDAAQTLPEHLKDGRAARPG